jgi:hypothetical protein
MIRSAKIAFSQWLVQKCNFCTPPDKHFVKSYKTGWILIFNKNRGCIMTAENEIFLQESKEELTQILRPFQQEVNRRQRLADFLKQCIRCTERDDFLQLDELLKSKSAEDIETEESLEVCKSRFDLLRSYANEKVERYRTEFIGDLTRLAGEAELPIAVNFPHFSVLKGIEGTVDFSKRSTIINKKILKSVDPRRIIMAVQKLKRQLYDRPYDPRAFADSLYQTYAKIVQEDNLAPGDTAPIQRFYLVYVLSLQSKPFFQSMEKAKFREYSLDQFVVDLWRFFESGIGSTSSGHVLQLRPGRNNSLWLIDAEGERRQITGISFQEGEK